MLSLRETIKEIKNSGIYLKTAFLRSIEYKSLYVSYYILDIIIISLLTAVFSYVDKGKLPYYLAYFIIQLIVFSPLWKLYTIVEDIIKGDLAIYLKSPINYVFFRFWYLIGLDIYRIVVYTFIVLVIAHIWLNTPEGILSFLLFLPLSAFMEYLYGLSVALMAFYIYDIKELARIIETIGWFLRGALIPFTYFPSWLISLSNKIFFSYIGYYKFVVLTNPSILLSLNFWKYYLMNFFVLGIISWVLWKKGLKRFESQGG